MVLASRCADVNDIPVLSRIMDAAIDELQRDYLGEAQIASSRAIMGIDTQLIDDGTYYVVDSDGEIAGCGGWSRRATLYGRDSTPGRSSRLLDPSRRGGAGAGYVHESSLRPPWRRPADPFLV